MGRKVSAPRPCDAEHDARIDLLDRILDGGEDAVGELDIVGEVLPGVGARDFAVVLVHQLVEADVAAHDRALERRRNLFGGIDHDADQRRVRRLYAAGGDQFDQPLGKVEQLCDPVVGAPQIGRGQVDALGEVVEFVNHHVAMGEVGGGRLRHPVDLAADRRKAVLDANDDALDLLGAFAGVLGPQRGVAALADQAADLSVEIAHGVADGVCGLAGGLRKALDLARDHRETAAGGAGAGGLDGRVQRQEIGLLRDRLDRAGYLGDLRERGTDRAETVFDASHRCDQFGDVLDRGFHRCARLGDFIDGGGRGRLHRLRRARDVAVGGNHGLGGSLQMPEPVGLGGDAARDLLQVSGHVRKLDPEAADPVRQLIDQTLAVGGGGCRAFHLDGLHKRHHCIPLSLREFEDGSDLLKARVSQSLYAVRKPPQWRPLTRIGTSISRIMTVLPLPMSRA